MENSRLAEIIQQLQEVKNDIDRISNDLLPSGSTFDKLESVGIQTGFVKRDLISLELHLAKVLKTARSTLLIWKETYPY